MRNCILNLGIFLVIFVQFGPKCLLPLLETKICENGICILVFHFPLVLSSGSADIHMKSPDRFLFACLDKVQKSLCTTPGFSVGVGVGIHIYVKVF